MKEFGNIPEDPNTGSFAAFEKGEDPIEDDQEVSHWFYLQWAASRLSEAEEDPVARRKALHDIIKICKDWIKALP